MVEAYGGGSDDSHSAAAEQCLVRPGAGAYNQSVCVLDVFGADFCPSQVADLGEGLKYPLKEGDFIVSNYLHKGLTQCIFTPERSIPRNQVI